MSFTRPRRNFARDFSDGVLVAELIAHFCPRLVDLLHYRSCNATTQKVANWNQLNQKPLKKLGMELSRVEVVGVTTCKLAVLEKVLLRLQARIQAQVGTAPVVTPQPADGRAAQPSPEPEPETEPETEPEPGQEVPSLLKRSRSTPPHAHRHEGDSPPEPLPEPEPEP